MPTLEHFALYAADVKALKGFYEEALGLRVVVDNGAGTPPGYFLADDRGMALEVIGRPEGESAARQRYVCHVAFHVDDFAEAKAALERRGARFETDTVVDTPEMQTAFFDDPEGNRLQIVWRARPLTGDRARS